MIDLPNSKWVRSPKMPEYAVCMDPQDRFFGWKMMENPDGVHWTSVGKMSLEEAIKAEGVDEFADLKYEAGLLIDLLRDERRPVE